MDQKEITTLIRMAGENITLDEEWADHWLGIQVSLKKGNYVYAAWSLGTIGSMKANVFCNSIQKAIK